MIHRRDFLKASAAGLAAGVLSSPLLGADAPAVRPNILMILVDDLGLGDLSSFGAPDLRTPHIDRLVAEGMRFDRFYASCPVCSPTRASLLTGRYPPLAGVPGVIRTAPGSSWGYLSPQAVLLPSVLKPAGYHTALVGKWHLGLESPNTPNERGFDFFHGFLGDMMDDYYTHRRHNINYMRRNREEIDPKGHATDLFTQWAIDFFAQRPKDKPFFLYLAYNAPHDPIQPPPEWLEKASGRIADPKRAKLAAHIEHLDDGIGKVIAALDAAGLRDNTLVIFTSDNGGALNVAARNGPVRDGKGTVYEGGIRVAGCARWPGRIAPGSRCDLPAVTMDLMPTMAEAAGVPIQHAIDGRSFLPALLGQKQEWPARDLFFNRLEGNNFKGWTTEAIRRGDWKLLRAREGPWELYNLAEDPLEKANLAGREPARVAELAAALQRQLEAYDKVPCQPPKKPG